MYRERRKRRGENAARIDLLQIERGGGYYIHIVYMYTCIFRYIYRYIDLY